MHGRRAISGRRSLSDAARDPDRAFRRGFRDRYLLLRNDQSLGHHFLRLKLVGTKSNRDAIGAWVTARLGKETLSRQVMPTRSYLSQSELPVTIGLGKLTQFEDLEITWPGGEKQKVVNAKLDATTVVEQVR